MAALEQGETVLITGGTDARRGWGHAKAMLTRRGFRLSNTRPGWIGSHVVHEALAAGLKPKLAIRDEAKARRLIESLERIHGKGLIETVFVPDFQDEGAYDEAIKGVQGVVHAASVLTLSSKPDDVIPPVLKGYENLLEAAHGNKEVRRVVLTSSAVACGYPNWDGQGCSHFDANSWDEKAAEFIKHSSPHGSTVYAASKVLSERAAWSFVKERRPSFVINTVNPIATFGAPIPGFPPSSTGTWITDLVAGRDSILNGIGPMHQVDVDDVAKLHIIALTRPDVQYERILAFCSPFDYKSIVDVILRVKPDAPIKPVPNFDERNKSTVDVRRANELLQSQGGLHDLEYSVRRNIECQ